MAFSHTYGTAPHHKAMYKMTSPQCWRDRYKDRCTERLQSSRSKLLNHLRNVPTTNTNVTAEETNIDNVMTTEWEKMIKELGAEERMHHNLQFDDVIKTMEEVKAELLEWEAEISLEYENKAMEADIFYHEMMAEDEMVICPVCSVNCLKVRFGSVQCICGVNIDTGQDSISSHHIKVCLDEGTQRHSQTCSTSPVFGVVQNFGTTNLLITCAECDYMYIVI